MKKKCFKSRLGAVAMAVALAFSVLSAAMPGNVAHAEENVAAEGTDFVIEEEEATEEIVDSSQGDEELTGDVRDYIKEDTEVTIEADLAKENDVNTADDEDEFVTVSGNIIGYESDEPLEIKFDCLGLPTYIGENHDATTLAVDGQYSVKLHKHRFYEILLPYIYRYTYTFLDADEDGCLYIDTEDEDIEFDIYIQRLDSHNDFVTVSGKIIGHKFGYGETFEYVRPLEILFECYNPYDPDYNETTIAKDGRYSVKLRTNCLYYVALRESGVRVLLDDDGGLPVLTEDKDREINIDIILDNIEYINGELDYGDLKDITDGDYVEFFEDTNITFEGEYETFTDKISNGAYNNLLPEGDYTVTLSGKTGNVYSVDTYYTSGYWGKKNHSTLVYYGDYRTRDNEARIVCSFEDTLGLDLSDATFYFVDSDKNRTNDCSYNEIIYGLIRLPKDKSYKFVASGLPEGYELDYGKMSSIRPLQEHCGDGRYDYTVAIRKVEPYKPLTIVNDTEDIVAKNGSKITFRIEAEGTDLKYSWYYKKPGADKYTKAGVYTNEYTRTAGKSTDGMQAYCMVSDSKGMKVHGRVATFSLDKQIEISYPNGKNLSATKGKKVDFIIYATSDLKLSYSWYYMVPTTNGGDGKYHKAGCYTDTYTRTAGNKIDGMQAYCLITDSTGHQVKSDVITFTLK